MASINDPSLPTRAATFDPGDNARGRGNKVNPAEPYSNQFYYKDEFARALETSVKKYIANNRVLLRWPIEKYGNEKKLRNLLNCARAYVVHYSQQFDPAVIDTLQRSRFTKSGNYMVLMEFTTVVPRSPTSTIPALDEGVDYGESEGTDTIVVSDANIAGPDDEPTLSLTKPPALEPERSDGGSAMVLADVSPQTDLRLKVLQDQILAWHNDPKTQARSLFRLAIGLNSAEVSALQVFVQAQSIPGRITTSEIKLVKL